MKTKHFYGNDLHIYQEKNNCKGRPQSRRPDDLQIVLLPVLENRQKCLSTTFDDKNLQNESKRKILF